MTGLQSTAEIVKPVKHFFFGKRNLTIKGKKGVVGHNYYADFGLKALHSLVLNSGWSSFMEAGCGRGVYSLALLSLPNIQQGAGVDINPAAFELTRENLELNKISKPFELENADIKEYFEKDFQVDLIAFDLPLIPLPPNNEMPASLRTMIDGGPDGRKYLDFMIQNSFPHLREKGAVFFVQPDFSGCEKTLKMLSKNGFEPKIVGEKKKYLAETITTRALKPYIEETTGCRFEEDERGEFFSMKAVCGLRK